MAREITAQATGLIKAPSAEANAASLDDYKDRLVKLIPSEIVTAYLTIHGLIAGKITDKIGKPVAESSLAQNMDILLWIVIVVLFILTPVYLYYVSNVRKWIQIIYTSFAFLIWVIVIGSPLVSILGISAPFIGSILLILYTLFIPLIYKG